jgi:hypothetical protein
MVFHAMNAQIISIFEAIKYDRFIVLLAEKIRVIKFGEVEEIFILVRRDAEMILFKFVLEIEIMRLAT